MWCLTPVVSASIALMHAMHLTVKNLPMVPKLINTLLQVHKTALGVSFCCRMLSVHTYIFI